MKQLYQNDPRWKDQKIGLQNSLTIGQVGCMLTSLAMTVNYFGGNETPATLNERMKAANGFNGAWIKSAQVPGQFPQLGFQRQKYADGKKAPIRLSLRSAPRIAADTLIKYLPLGAKLTLRDPADAVKIGRQNQWLPVKTSDGTEGYVAAWYVKNAS
jgi:hypothetical protein